MTCKTNVELDYDLDQTVNGDHNRFFVGVFLIVRDDLGLSTCFIFISMVAALNKNNINWP